GRKADAVCHHSDGRLEVRLANLAGWDPANNWGVLCPANVTNWVSLGVADFDGDDKSDLLCLERSRIFSGPRGIWVDPSNGGAFAPPGLWWTADFCDDAGDVGIARFNADKKADLWCRTASTGDIGVLLAATDPAAHRFYDGSTWAPGLCPFL